MTRRRLYLGNKKQLLEKKIGYRRNYYFHMSIRGDKGRYLAAFVLLSGKKRR